MGNLAAQIESAKALKEMAAQGGKPWHKKPEMWLGIIANLIAIIALFT